MKLLLDTHTFLWWALEPEKLPERVCGVLEDPANQIFFSTVSSWEAQIKLGLGKLLLKVSLQSIIMREIEQNGWDVLPVTLSHTWALSNLEPPHKDPLIQAYQNVDWFWG